MTTTNWIRPTYITDQALFTRDDGETVILFSVRASVGACSVEGDSLPCGVDAHAHSNTMSICFARAGDVGWTALHELAHLLSPSDLEHGDDWQRAMNLLGQDVPSRYIKSRKRQRKLRLDRLALLVAIGSALLTLSLLATLILKEPVQ